MSPYLPKNRVSCEKETSCWLNFPLFLKVPGIMGCFQALEVLKIASGKVCILLIPLFQTVPFCIMLLTQGVFLQSHVIISTKKLLKRFSLEPS